MTPRRTHYFRDWFIRRPRWQIVLFGAAIGWTWGMLPKWHLMPSWLNLALTVVAGAGVAIYSWRSQRELERRHQELMREMELEELRQIDREFRP